MLKRAALIVAGFLLLAGCSSTAPSSYPIATGPLRTDEIPLANYGNVGLASRVFDVVNQDQAAASNTGIAGGVQPMPVDVLSSYAASKFHANGGIYATRFVVKQGGLQVRTITPPKSTGFFSSLSSDGDPKAELAVDLSVMVVATKPDGTGVSITATTSQSQQTGFGGTPEDHRKVYLDLMARALAALDAEISRQLPTYFSGIVAR